MSSAHGKLRCHGWPMVRTNSDGTTIELEWFARVQRDELLALIEDQRAIDDGLAVSINMDEVQRNSPRKSDSA